MSNDAIKPEDRALFRDAMSNVRPLDREERVAHRGRTRPEPVQARADDDEVMRELAAAHWDPAEVETGEELVHARSGVRRQTLRKLRRGAYSIRDELDLHHMNEAAARQSLDEFLRYHYDQGSGCVKVIHGKGLRSRGRGPVLKRLVNSLLRRRPEVVAFASAKPADGGTGAVYVLLRQQRPQGR